jgi:hypothetical protein
MNDNMRKVLVALRGGKYKQSTHRLHTKEGYCCLGVMCVVYEEETGDKLRRSDTIDGRLIMGTCLGWQPRVKEWVGLRHGSGNNYGTEHSLITMNDEQGASFLEIADFIELEPKGLLV